MRQPVPSCDYVWHVSFLIYDEWYGHCRWFGDHRPCEPEQLRYVLPHTLDLVRFVSLRYFPRFVCDRNLFLARLLHSINRPVKPIAYPASLPSFFVSYIPIAACKLIPILVAVALPAPSHAIASPRGVKRSRTPERSGNGLADADQDDGTCALGQAFQFVLSTAL